MKPNILTKTIAALLLALPVAHAEDIKADDKKNGEKKEGRKPDTTKFPPTDINLADGTATVTIDINGKKETRTFKLSDENNSFYFGKEGDGAKAGGSVQFGGGKIGAPGQAVPLNAKREKGPWIGIAMEPVQEVVASQLSLAPGEGVVVNHVAPESPAAKAGLQANDILLRFDDQIIVEPAQLRKLVAMKKPGENVKLTYLRKGERKESNLTLVEHELESGEHGPTRWFQMAPGGGGFKPGGAPGSAPNPWGAVKGGGGIIMEERMQDQLKQLKEKHPGVIVEKRSWVSGEQGAMLKGQMDKLIHSIEESNLPKEQIEQLRKQLDRVRHEAEEAMENAKRGSQEAVEHARREAEEMAKARDKAAQQQREKENIGGQPQKPGVRP